MWKNNEWQTKKMRIQITNGHIEAKGVWVMHVRELGWQKEIIGIPNEATEAQAQKAAVKKIKRHLKEI